MLYIGFSILLKKDWTEIVHIHFPTALGYSLHIYHNVHSTLINISDVYSNIYIWNVRRWHLPGRQISKNYNTRYDVDTRKITMQLSKTMNAFYYIPYHILIKAF